MKTNRTRWRRSVPVLLAVGLLAGAGAQARADDCGKSGPGTFKMQPGDATNTTHLDVSRRVAGPGRLELNVCSGELRLQRAAAPGVLRMQVTSPGADRVLANYLQTFQISGSSAVIDLRIPSRYHPVITIFVPPAMAEGSEINLGAGTLLLGEDVLKGSRELNVGAGKAVIYLSGGRDYATLEANVGVGKLTDELPGGHNAYGVVSKSLSGKGAGTLKVNVGAGEVDLKPASE